MSQFIVELKSALKEDILDLDSLARLLDQEKALLKTRKSDQIKLISEHKSGLIKKIEMRGKTKAKLFAKSGLGIRPGQVETALLSLKDDELSKLWTESRNKLTSCKEQNLVNGAIINQSLNRTSRLMNILRGKNKAPNLYGQRGKEQSYAGSQRIGKA